MPRRRMIDPVFWDDHYIGMLSRDERLFLIGCIGNADDEGRLKGHPAYLKASIFMYDDDLSTTAIQEIKGSCLEKMANWPRVHPHRLVMYQNSSEEYLAFPNWSDTQKPSHPTPSKLPAAPPDVLSTSSSSSPDDFESNSGEAPPQYSVGKYSVGKVSVGNIPEIDAKIAELAKAFERLSGQLPSGTDGEWMADLKERYEVSVIIQNMEKAVRVTKHWPGWKYVETMLKGGKARDRPGRLPTGEELKESWGDVARRSDATLRRLVEEGKIEDFRARDSPSS